MGADEDEREYFKEAEMAQALGQAHEAFGFGSGSNAAPLTALAPCNSNTVQGIGLPNVSMEAGVTATPGAIGALPGTPMSAATPLVNSSMFGANAPATPWTGPHNSNSMQATPMAGVHGGSGALSFATPASASLCGSMMMQGGEQTPDIPGVHTPGSMAPPPMVGKGPAPPRRGRTSTGDGASRGTRAGGPLGFGVVRSLDGENTDPVSGNMSTPVAHSGVPGSGMLGPPSATRRVTRSSAASATSGSGVGSITLGGNGNASVDEAISMEEDPPPHKKKAHLQQSGMIGSLGARQSQNWQTGGSSWSPRLQDQASAPMLLVPGDTSELCILFRQLANAYRHLCMYRSHEAIKAFSDLPKCQFNTGWVLAQLATAHFNMAQHRQAELAFRRCRQLEPHRVRGMEIYSTVLWFLKREHELCYLAQEMVALDRLAPQTWCVLGNCFSLQREFETAIKFFHRAIQVDSTFTYAYTLAGHEHVSNEDFDKATASFRDALRFDQRHYNAWYDLTCHVCLLEQAQAWLVLAPCSLVLPRFGGLSFLTPLAMQVRPGDNLLEAGEISTCRIPFPACS